MISDFEAYLLLRMRAKIRVRTILDVYNCSYENLRIKSERAIDSLSLRRTGICPDTTLYTKMVGEPISRRPLGSNETPQMFSGSIESLYQLRLWPKVLFRVNRAREGYAWGEAFVQRKLVELPLDIKRITPWEFTDEALEAAAAQVAEIDNWHPQRDLLLKMYYENTIYDFKACFDFGLLQTWESAEKSLP